MSSDSDFTAIPSPDTLFRFSPYASAALVGTALDTNCTAVEIKGELNELVSGHVARHARAPKSFSMTVGRGKASCCDGSSDDETDDESIKRVATPSLGLGLFPFEFNGHQLYALNATYGQPVGTDCGAQLYQSLVLLSPGPNDLPKVKSFCDWLIDKADETEEQTFTTYKWHVQYHYWQRAERCAARPMESVVLPKAAQARLISDLDDFTSKGTRKWYAEHGIPYKRSYLLWGSPGAGKTSLIQALAGKYSRSICYLSPSHPEMTDDGLKNAVQRVPTKSIIVLEDVDALFQNGRGKKESDKSSLTFSGVLNALDGVGGSSGQIFVLTTNHRDKLDPALIRNGRVDLHVEFTDATAEQMQLMFVQFYAKSGLAADKVDELAAQFASALTKELGERSVSCAALQHYFIQMRKASAEEAAAGVNKVIEEMEAHGKLAEEEKTRKEREEKKKGEDENKEGEKEQEEKKEKKAKGGSAPAAATSEGKAIHIHVH